MKSSKFYSNATFAAAVVAAIFVEFFLLWGLCSLVHPAKAADVPAAPKFDTTQLETWCNGGDTGTLRMVGGWYYEDGVIEDETGNLWGWDGEINPDAFLLLWINDNGTPEIEDDEIVKLWQEI